MLPSPPPPPRLRTVRPVATVAVGALAVACHVNLAIIVIDIGRYAFINQLMNDPYSVSGAEIDAHDAVWAAAGIAEMTAFALAAVAFLVWLFRVRLNAEALAPDGHRHGKPWLILGWVLPIVSFWYPKQIVDDIWAASGGTTARRRSRLVLAWWLVWVTHNLASWVATRMLLQEELDEMAAAAVIDAVSLTLPLVAAALLAVVVSRVTGMQEDRGPVSPAPYAPEVASP